MLVRVRSKDGNFRFDLQPSSDISELLSRIVETAVNPDISTITISNQPRGNEQPISSLRGRSLREIGLAHGDLVFVFYKEASAPSSSTADHAPSSSTQAAVPDTTTKRIWEMVQEDPVDIYWRSKDGKIPRGRDATFCKHGPKGMCDYCMPLEPYDAAYQKAQSIKHLSYHAYLRKLTPKNSSSSTADLPPLSPLDYRVKVPCPSGGHMPWPAGICTSCQPSAITLQSQPFRMVDHLEIASMEVVDRFLQAWRSNGRQGCG
ncbi:hypothetical protein ONZ45_g15930 [Pleurotus djamor]|nr:hypothetical protein ONZ45_g15930 [Pleurotus djamor]